MIPKVIHYCWFGKGELPELAKKCIASWQKCMPDWEIKEWNEDNFNVNAIEYTRQAYTHKKYAFVADFARFYIVEKYGGVYMDVDVELIKSLDDLIDDTAFLGFERIGAVNPGLVFGSVTNTKFCKDMLNTYTEKSFLNKDGSQNFKTIVDYTSEYLKLHGLMNQNKKQNILDVTIYPIEFFCPIDMDTNQLVITKKTYSIHHFASSWLTPWGKLKKRIRKLVGNKLYSYLYRAKKCIKTKFRD